MSPGTGKGFLFRLAELFDQNPGSEDWFEQVEEYARGALAEASNCRVASNTKALLALLSEFYARPISTLTYEETGHAIESEAKSAWVDWLMRLEWSAEARSIPGLTKVLDEFRSGTVAVPVKVKLGDGAHERNDLFGAMFEKLGIDFAVRTSSPRGTGTSRSASVPEPQGNGKFRVFADGPDIKSGDGRVPKVSRRK